jgi:hypothetical protein
MRDYCIEMGSLSTSMASYAAGWLATATSCACRLIVEAEVPILGNVQLARWLAKPSRHEHGRPNSSSPTPRHNASAKYTSPN